MTFDSFSREIVGVAAGSVLVRRAGRGPAVLLLHGYPETSLAWRKVAPDLASEFTVIAADLPGYGDSTLSGSAIEEGRISKRTMARALADVMTELGISRFAVVGHDRGARVAYRLALDHPERIRAVAALDVVPILDMAEGLTYDAARQMGHWFWLAQSSAVPERVIGLDPGLYVRHIIEAWGGGQVIERDAVDEYVRCMRRPEVLRTMGAEYRADQIDIEHDRTDRAAGRRISCPLIALWAEGGLTEQFGDPLAIWRRRAEHATGGVLAGGHFLMEECPQELVAWLMPFLTDACRSDITVLNAPRRKQRGNMTSSKQRKAARRNVKKAAGAARRKRTIAHLPKRTRTALGKEGAKAAARKRRAGRTRESQH
jgi:haloacetate dehalogenase